MFDGLGDPNPPHADSRHFAAVAARAKRLRHRRWTATGGALATTTALVVGGFVVFGGDRERPISTDPTPASTVPQTRPPATTVPASTVPAASTAPPTSVHAAPTTPPATEPAVQRACAAVPGGVGLVVPDDSGDAVLIRDGTSTSLDLPAVQGTRTKAALGADGTVWTEIDLGGGRREVQRITPNGTSSMSASGEVELSSVGTLGGRTAAVIIDSTHPDGQESYGAIIVEFSDGVQTDVADAGGPEYAPISVTIGGERLVEGAVNDLTESFRYYGLDHEFLNDWYLPTDSAEYNAPPYFMWPMAADSGLMAFDPLVLSWVEGPDWDGATNRLAGEWSLVIVSARDMTGEDVLRIRLGSEGKVLMHADFDGRYWVGTFDDTFDPENGVDTMRPARVVVVDTHADRPAVINAECGEAAIATLDHAGDKTRPAVTPPSSSQPPSTTPAQDCGIEPESPVITDNINRVPPAEGLEGVPWVYRGDSNYNECAALSYALLDVEGATASSPYQLMLFHDGVYIGTATKCAFGFTSVVGSTDKSVTIEYRWPRAGDANAAPSGRATVTYRWNGEAVQPSGELPLEMRQASGCGT